MKILFYCQHVWGVGHYFRSMEICRGLHGHEVVMAIGGPPFDAPIPPNVRLERLPPIKMRSDYTTLQSDSAGERLNEIKAVRRARLDQLYIQEKPDLLLIELYPFGRRKFKFELVPLLRAIRSGDRPAAKVVCSLRDILVAKQDAARYETDVVEKLNRYFDALLIHADRRLVALEDTFGRSADIDIPLVYTGFVAQSPPEGAAMRIRRQLGLGESERLLVASAGVGRSGTPLLEAVLAAVQSNQLLSGAQLHVFTGPFIESRDYERLAALKRPGVHISKFSDDFLAMLTAADLSISMGGYNTSMNILATGVPALVWPYPGDREQGIRARRLAELGALTVLSEADFRPSRMAAVIANALARSWTTRGSIAMDGARRSARAIESLVKTP